MVTNVPGATNNVAEVVMATKLDFVFDFMFVQKRQRFELSVDVERCS